MNSARKIAIIGGKGNGLVVAQIVEDLARSGQPIEMAGFLNDHEPIGSLIGQHPVIGRSTNWPELDADVHIVFALLSVGKMQKRSELLASLQVPESRLATLIHPTALIGFGVSVGNGSVVASYVTCQPGSSIGNNSIVRAGVNLGHDSRVGDFVDIGPNSTLCGYSAVGRGAHVAPNSVVRDRVSVGEFSVLSAGSVALKDIEPGTTWMGNPARRVR